MPLVSLTMSVPIIFDSILILSTSFSTSLHSGAGGESRVGQGRRWWWCDICGLGHRGAVWGMIGPGDGGCVMCMIFAWILRVRQGGGTGDSVE